MTGGARTAQVARFVAGTRSTHVPVEVAEAARRAIADSLGVMLAGRRSGPGSVVAAYAETATGPAGAHWTASRAGRVTSAEVAAMVNATLGHALDYDDSMPGVGHGGVPVLAAALATAETLDRPVDGDSLTTAFAVGVEVMARVARSLGVGHTYERGFHMTCTAGTFGATAVASRLRNLDEPQTATALGIAGSLVGGMQRNFGTTVKPLHSGLAARNGVLAAHLASVGATAADEIFDGDRGLLRVFGTHASSPEPFDQLGSPFSLQEPGTALKRYPCCYVAARPIDAILRLREEHGIVPEQVGEVVCAIPVGGMHPMAYPDPADGLQAKFSMPYLLAAALVDGTVGLASFEESSVARPEVRGLMARVTAVEDEALRPEDPQGRTSSPATGGRVEVAVVLTDGTRYEASETEPYGGPLKPLSWDDIQAKFVECAEHGGYARTGAQEAFALLQEIGGEGDVLSVLDTLAAAQAG